MTAHSSKPRATVESTATTTVRKVRVDTLHPVPLARSSHLSFAVGQILGLPMGAKIPIGQSLATQVED